MKMFRIAWPLLLCFISVGVSVSAVNWLISSHIDWFTAAYWATAGYSYRLTYEDTHEDL